MFTRRLQRVLASSALAAAIVVVGALPAPVAAAPSAEQVARSRAAVDRAVERYTTARRKADALEASLAESSARLDALIAEQQAAQARLSAHVESTYRYGPLTFLEVITAASTFEDFATRWFLLTRIGEQDAQDIARVKAARTRALAQARETVALQEKAAAELALARAAAQQARADLAGDRAAYASYLRRVRASASAGSGRTKPSPKYDAYSGTGAWQTAKASHYGKGSWGHKTADGTRIRSDSMIVAHKTLPFGTLVEFEYNGKRAVARVADRGPYVKGREWDLGPGVIAVLGFNGVHMVKYRIIGR